MVAPTLAGGGSVPSPDALLPVLFKDLLASGLEAAASLHAATSGVPTMGAATRAAQSGNDTGSTGTASPATAEHHHIAFYLPIHAASTGASDSIGKNYSFTEETSWWPGDRVLVSLSTLAQDLDPPPVFISS